MFDVPVFVQDNNLPNCGSECLRMLLSYYGTDITWQEAMEVCNVGVKGCSFLDIKHAGDNYGLNLVAYADTASDLIQYDRPAIIHWKHNHVCIFAGMSEDGRAWIINPMRGKYRVSVDSLSKLYTNVALANGTRNLIENIGTGVDASNSLTPDEVIDILSGGGD